MASKFPELSSVTIEGDEDALEYFVTREQFENKYPARKARQATNKAAWKALEKPTFTNVEPIEIPEENAQSEEISEVKSEEGGQSEGEEKSLRSEFEVKLDESQLQVLEEIRARRERKRGK
jgi:hypothetical protein